MKTKITFRKLLISLSLFCLVGFQESIVRSENLQVDVSFENLKSLLEERNSRIRVANLQKAAAESRKDSLGRSFLPRIEIHGAEETFKNGNENWRSQPTYGVEIKSNIYNGGRDRLDSEMRSLGVDRRSVLREQVLSEELQLVRKHFWEAVAGSEKLDLLEEMVKLNAKNLNAAERRIRSGVATESDRVEFEMKAVDLKREMSETRLKQQQSRRQLSLVLGLESSVNLRLPSKLEHSHNFEDMLKHESKEHEFLYLDDLLIGKETELAAEKERRAWLPKIEAFAGYKRFNEREEESANSSTGRRDETVLGLRFTMSTEDFVNSRREAAALSKEAEADFVRSQFKRREIEAHMENEISELRFVHSQVHDAEANIERAERYYKLTQSEYSRGVKNSPDVLGASERLFENRMKRIDLIRDFQIAKSHALAKLGR